VKRDAPVAVVLGNPPYSGVSRNNSTWISNLIATYKTEPEGGPLKERKHWLNDDYVKFFRFAHDRIMRTGFGVVAFITNHGWLDNPTFRGMRARLMEDFDDIFVLNLHGNSKKKEETPEALKSFGHDKNVFDIEQGVSIAFLVKLAPQETAKASEPEFTLAQQDASESKSEDKKLRGGRVTLRARIHYADLWGSREHKYGWLESHSIETSDWQSVNPPMPQLPIVPRNETGLSDYERGWIITDIFPKNTSGIVTARDSLVFDFTVNDLTKKIRRFTDVNLADQEIRRLFFRSKADAETDDSKYEAGDTRGWKLAAARKALRASEWEKTILSCLYRPFDNRALLYSKTMVDWGRWDLMAALVGKHELPNLAIVASRMTKGEPFAHAFITDRPSEVICLSPKTSNNGFVFPLWVADAKSHVLRANVSEKFIGAIRAQRSISAHEDTYPLTANNSENILAYIYAVLHAPSYRSRYAEFLKSDFQRIPIALDAAAPTGCTFAEVWIKLLPLGQEMIDLHLLRKVPSALRASFNVSGGSEVEKPRYEPPNTPMNPGPLGRVYINATQCFEGVMPETWAFKVGGYQVCEKWLKDRKGRALASDDVDHYRNVVAALTRTQSLMQEIDAVVNGVLWPKS
jgi:predicted helicase